MPIDRDQIDPPRDLAQAATWRWCLAGAVGLILAVTIVLVPPFPRLPILVNALVGIGSGWLAMMLLAPWRDMTRLSARRSAVVRLTRQLRRINGGGSDLSLNELVRLRDDDLGVLREAIHDTLTRAVADRRESRLLHRRMDDEIRRETDRATHHLKREATTDPLTGLGNRRTLTERLQELFAPDRRKRHGSIVAMVLDLDLFKRINDTLGHDEGDRCLAFVGNLLTSTIRREDSAIRHGGDEFIVLMPNQSVDEAEAVAHRIRTLFAQMPWPHADVPRPTLSVGLASAFCADPQGAEKVIRRADEALYCSKNSGRNTVTTYADQLSAA